MSPKALMWLGVMCGTLFGAGELVGTMDLPASIFVFAAGALFGKGYGIWEERWIRRKYAPTGWYNLATGEPLTSRDHSFTRSPSHSFRSHG